MSVSVLRSKLISLALAGALASVAPSPGKADAPMRVVSINVCTDQLAMLLAGEGQLHSVSNIATDPRTSAMAAEAEAFVPNAATAEEVFLMKPDLVVAGAYTARTTVDLLRDFGIPVEIFAPVTSVDEVPLRMAQMGAVLGRTEAATVAIDAFNARLDELRSATDSRPRAALYFANGYTLGDQTLAGQILLAAGLSNVAEEAGYTGGGVMPLEILALADPDVIVTVDKYPGASRSESIMDHPVVQSTAGNAAHGQASNRDWICGTPFVLRAIEELAQLRARIKD